MLRSRTIGRAALFAAALLLVGAPPAHATDPAIGTGCSPQRGNSARYDNGNNSWCNGSTWQYPAYQFGSTALGCTTTQAGMIEWTGSAFQGCNGSSWQGFTLGGNIALGTSTTAANPYIAGDATSGFYTPGAGTVAVVTGGNEALRVTSSGYVGIGTVNPISKLQIIGNGSGAVRLGADAGCGSNYAAIFLNDGAETCGNYNLMSGPSTSDNNLYINTPSGKDIHFRENNIDHMILKTGGNVGIGTASPAAQLSIVGASTGGVVYVQNTNSSGYASLDLYDNNGTKKGGIGYGNSGAGAPYISAVYVAADDSSTPLEFVTNGNPRMYITTTGFVGIGTTAPAATMHVNGGAIVGNDAAACSATNAGEIKYTGSVMEYCNGTSWVTINGNAAPTPGCGTSATLSSSEETTVSVAAGCTVQFKVWGAAGGGGGSNNDCGGIGGGGGGGGYATITLGPLGSATTYYLVVGGGGGGGQIGTLVGGISGAGLTGYGGGVGAGGGYQMGGGGGGGSASGVWTGSYGGTAVVVAGAGGGGSGASGCSSYVGGLAGGTGTQTVGTAGQNGSTSGDGGGGSGYTTGGAEGSSGQGGSNYAAVGGTTATGSGPSPGNSGDPNLPSGAGAGGAGGDNSSGSTGGTGAIYYQTY